MIEEWTAHSILATCGIILSYLNLDLDFSLMIWIFGLFYEQIFASTAFRWMHGDYDRHGLAQLVNLDFSD